MNNVLRALGIPIDRERMQDDPSIEEIQRKVEEQKIHHRMGIYGVICGMAITVMIWLGVYLFC